MPNLGTDIGSGGVTLMYDLSTPATREWCKASNRLEPSVIPGNIGAFFDLLGGIGEDARAEYATTPVLGRGESFRNYVGTSNRVVPMMVRFAWQGVVDVTADADQIRMEVMRPALLLDALKYPAQGQDGTWWPPPTVILNVGGFLRMRATADCSIQWTGEITRISATEFLPTIAEVSCVFTSAGQLMAPSPWTMDYDISGENTRATRF
jgi:hypothetical protein